MQVIKDLFGSKKFLATLVGILSVLIGKIGWNIADETLTQVVALVASFVVGQSIADFGKEKAKIEAAATPGTTP